MEIFVPQGRSRSEAPWRLLTRTAAAALCALGLSLASVSEASASATACRYFACDDHNPEYQTWQVQPATVYSNGNNGTATVDLRRGVTGGDEFGWARVHYFMGSGGGQVYVDRRNKGGGGEESRLGVREIGAAGWSKGVSTNYMDSWSGMFYNPSYKQVRACVYLYSNSYVYCTQWF